MSQKDSPIALKAMTHTDDFAFEWKYDDREEENLQKTRKTHVFCEKLFFYRPRKVTDSLVI